MGLLVALLAGAFALSSLAMSAPALAASAVAAPGWMISVHAEPTNFNPALDEGCETDVAIGAEKGREGVCDFYTLVVTNVGAASSSGPVTVSDVLPAGTKALAEYDHDEAVEENSFEKATICEAVGQKVTCTVEDAVEPYESFEVEIPVAVEAGALGSTLADGASVEGGEAAAPSESSTSTVVSEAAAPFALLEASQAAWTPTGTRDTHAGGHAAALTTSFFFSNAYKYEPETSREELKAPESPRDEIVDLPAGLIGDPQALERCPLEDAIYVDRLSHCPAASEVGLITIRKEGGLEKYSGSQTYVTDRTVTPIYNLVPEGGYPAEFGFDFEGILVVMHAEVGPPPAYGLRVTIPGQTSFIKINGVIVTFFGDPSEHDDAGATPSYFLSNPADCTAGPLSATVSVDTHEHPETWLSQETNAYPSLTGCEALSFTPSLSLTPESTAPDTPNGYQAELSVPANEALTSSTLASPPLKDATVTLPAGVAISPGEAQGLVGCDATGPEGFNALGGQTAPDGQDLSDLEATELGEGHPGGNASPYDDGLYHDAPGHCPGASTLGTVRLRTPLLSEELTGHIYLAEPTCGGAGQPECTPQLAEEGKIFGLDLELSGSGVIVKLAGQVKANASTGQLTAVFYNNPQLPFSDLKLNFNSGPRAALTNPQTCGTYTTSSLLEPWSAPQTATALSESSFQVTGCDGFPFAPSFSAGTTDIEGGAYSPFTLTFGRKDGEQDLSTIALQMPPGLLGKIAGVPECGEAQANAGTCGAESQIGTTTVAAGSGTAPLYLSGRVYLTGPYGGDPFGLSIVVPAIAGPFNLGNVVVRASIAINPATAALTVTSTPIPQVIDGVPTRLQSVNVDIDRPGFTFNATNCAQQQIGASISSAQGTSAGVSAPYAPSGCKNLAFSPKFSASTRAHTSPKQGAALRVHIGYTSGQANIKRVDLTLPKKFSARLEPTLKHACTEAQFAANPAGCPKKSFAGTAKAVTPLLDVPLTGSAIFVSHGGAKFPDLDLVLQGQGVTIILTGRTEIVGDTTYSRFETVPDAPVSSFSVNLPEGPHSALSPNLPKRTDRSFCGRTLLMPTMIEGQNGAVLKQTTHIKLDGCGPILKIVSQKVSGDTATIKASVPSAGKLEASGKGLTSKTKKAPEAKLVTLKLKLRTAHAAKHAKSKQKIKVKLAFMPRHGKKLVKQVNVVFKRKGGSQ